MIRPSQKRKENFLGEAGRWMRMKFPRLDT